MHMCACACGRERVGERARESVLDLEKSKVLASRALVDSSSSI